MDVELERAIERLTNWRDYSQNKVISLSGQERFDLIEDIKAVEKLIGYIRSNEDDGRYKADLR